MCVAQARQCVGLCYIGGKGNLAVWANTRPSGLPFATAVHEVACAPTERPILFGSTVMRMSGYATDGWS